MKTEMKETLGFPFQNGRFVKPEKAGQVKPLSLFRSPPSLYSVSEV